MRNEGELAESDSSMPLSEEIGKWMRALLMVCDVEVNVEVEEV